MKKETFFGLAMLSLAGCSTTSQQTAALDVQPLEEGFFFHGVSIVFRIWKARTILARFLQRQTRIC